MHPRDALRRLLPAIALLFVTVSGAAWTGDSQAVGASQVAPAHSAGVPKEHGTSARPTPALSGSTAVSYGWARTWGGNGASVRANGVTADTTGMVYVVGEFSGTVNFDPLGNSAGSTITSHNGTIDAFLAQYTSAGSFRWARAWGGGVVGGTGPVGRDTASSVGVSSTGDVFVVGHYQYTVDFNPAGGATHTSNAGSANNVFVSSFDSQGTFRWVRTWGPADGGAEGYSVAIDALDNIYVVGDFTGSGCDFAPWSTHDYHANHPPAPGSPFGALFDSYLSKLDSNGNFLWARTWGGEGYDDGPGVAVDGVGNVYVGGMYASQTINFDPAGGSAGLGHPANDSGIKVDAFLSKFSSDGTFQWVRTWGAAGTDEVGATVAADGAGGIYLAGRFGCTACDFNPGPGGSPDLHSTQGDADGFVSKFRSDGTFEWARTFGGTGADAVGNVMPDGWGNVYASGLFANTISFGAGVDIPSHGDSDAFVARFDATGNLLDALTWGGTGADGANRLARDQSGSVYVAGWFQNLVDFDPSGGVDQHTAVGIRDGFLSRLLAPTTALPYAIYLPRVTNR